MAVVYLLRSHPAHGHMVFIRGGCKTQKCNGQGTQIGRLAAGIVAVDRPGTATVIPGYIIACSGYPIVAIIEINSIATDGGPEEAIAGRGIGKQTAAGPGAICREQYIDAATGLISGAPGIIIYAGAAGEYIVIKNEDMRARRNIGGRLRIDKAEIACAQGGIQVADEGIGGAIYGAVSLSKVGTGWAAGAV